MKETAISDRNEQMNFDKAADYFMEILIKNNADSLTFNVKFDSVLTGKSYSVPVTFKAAFEKAEEI